MTIETIQQMWASYLSAYSDILPTERERLLRQSVADDIVFSNPTGELGHGLGNLIEHVAQFQAKLPGAHFKIKDLLTHHGQLLSEWTMQKKDGSELVSGHTFARFNEQGQLTLTAGFWKA